MMIHCTDVTLSTCRVKKERTSEMIQLYTGVLKAAKMYDVSVRRTLQCSALCLSELTCYYITVNSGNTSCILYTSGSTTYDVSSLRAYTVKYKNIKVLSQYCKRYCDIIVKYNS